MNETFIITGQSALIIGSLMTSDAEIERYRQMAHDYHLACSKEPYVKRCELAFKLGARQFSIAPSDLRRPERGGGRLTPLVETRQKLMAFARVVSEQDAVPNSWKKIGRAFNRSHATVIHAAHKYGEQVAAALA